MKHLIPYHHLLKFKEVAGFDSAQFPPFHNLEYADRERLIMHMMNTFSADRRSFAIFIKKATAPKKTASQKQKITKSKKPNTLDEALQALSNDQILDLAKKLLKKGVA